MIAWNSLCWNVIYMIGVQVIQLIFKVVQLVCKFPRACFYENIIYFDDQ